MLQSSRPSTSVEIFDVTIRDGSYAIDFQFTPDDIRQMCAALERAGFGYIEIGHGFGLNGSVVKQASAATDEETLAAAAESVRQARFGTFFIPGIGEKEHLLRARRDFGMHFVRIGDDPEKICETTLPYLDYARELGFEVMANFMKSYAITPSELARKSRTLVEHGAEAIYVVDSAGGMLPHEVAEYCRAIREECGARVGFHGHNNLQLAGANALAAVDNGCTLVDCSIGGLGRSAGNTRTELMILVLKRAGYEVNYDFLEVLRVYERVISPVLRHRNVSAEDVVGGYARIHSGLLGPFNELSKKYAIPVEALLYAYSDAARDADGRVQLEELAGNLAEESPAPAESPENFLLTVDRRYAGEDTIKNTFRAVDDVVSAVTILSKKANMPVAALVHVSPIPVDEQYLTADYLYHDDHFVVARIMCSTVELFEKVMRQHAGKFDVLAFEGLTKDTKEQLEAGSPAWRRRERVVFASGELLKYHSLFSALYSVAMDRGAENVLFFGGTRQNLVKRMPAEVAFLRHYFASSEGDELRIYHGNVCLPRAKANKTPFQVAVLLSAIDHQELDVVISHMPAGGAVIDCVHQAAAYSKLFESAGLEVVSLDLHRAFSGELLNLLALTGSAADDSRVLSWTPPATRPAALRRAS